jgi:beta-xylosidase
MLTPRHAVAAPHRPALALGIGASVIALALVVAAALGLTAPSAGAGNAREAGVGRVAHVGRVASLKPASTLGSAVATTALGLRTSYYQPAALADPARPGILDHTGWDEPDPFVFAEGGSYYLFTSQSNEPENLPVRTGASFGQWSQPIDALPDPPAWATPDVMWAPDVARFGNHYMLYFTSQQQNVANGTKCIGDAISTSPAGPYIASPSPFICQRALGGSIDPRVFVDGNGQPSMVWKSDQNSIPNGGPTQIWSQPLSADGMQLVGAPTAIFAPDQSWQNSIVEAPQMVLVQGSYYLFYSGGSFFTPGYAVGVARCAGPLGPCGDTTSTPLLGSNLQGWGPGEESIFTNGAGVWMVYSPWFANMSNEGPPRPVALAHLGFGVSGPYLAAPFQNGSPGVSAPTSTRAP